VTRYQLSDDMARVVAMYAPALVPIRRHVAKLTCEELTVLALALLDQAGMTSKDQERMLALRTCPEVWP
jgi:hypothetical protein